VGKQPSQTGPLPNADTGRQDSIGSEGGAETICDARRNKPENKLLYGERSNAASGELRNTISKLEMAMNQVQVEQQSYQMPPQDGFTVAHFLTVADVERSLRFYETVFGGRILSRGDNSGAPGYIQIANTWLLVNPGGGPTPDKPSVTLSVPANPDSVSSFMNIRVADIQACYELWRSRGAEFITEPKPKYGETRCYIRDPDGYIIEVGQSNPGVAYG
jgi:catechol 2,3-dioxygenase-like lactoylglutathione lyase family enzyme